MSEYFDCISIIVMLVTGVITAIIFAYSVKKRGIKKSIEVLLLRLLDGFVSAAISVWLVIGAGKLVGINMQHITMELIFATIIELAILMWFLFFGVDTAKCKLVR